MAANGRIYTMPLPSISIGTAVQDILSLLTGAAGGLELHWIHLDANVAAEAALYMRLKTGTTQGSAGTTPAISPIDSNDAAIANVTGHANDTTQATGTMVTLGYFYWDLALPFDFLPPPENRPIIKASSSIILDLPATITAVTIAGYIMFRPLP